MDVDASIFTFKITQIIKRLKYLFLFISLFHLNFLVGQEGNYFITNYSSNEYNGAVQNFDVIQDDFGLLYFANNNYILEYNGKVWQTIGLTDGGKTPTSFAKSKNGTIYVGGENEIGFLDRDSTGKVYYKSFKYLLNKNERNFNQVWNTLIIGDAVFYCSNERIIRYRNGKIKTWEPITSFHKAQVVNGMLLVREVDRGLFFLKGNNLEKIIGSELLAQPEYKIAFFLPTKNKGKFLIITRKKGVFNLNLNLKDLKNSIITKVTEEKFKVFDEFEPYDGIVLENNNIVIGSIDKGLFVFDRHFNLQQNISTSSGLINNECRKLFIDAQKNLWVVFNNGLSKVEINSPLKKWDKFSKIEGSVEKVIKYKDKIYLATSKGLMVYNSNDRVFEQVSRISERCIDLDVINEFLYVATENGLSSYDGRTVKTIYNEGAVYELLYNKRNSKFLYCGTDNSIIQIKSSDQSISDEIKSPVNSPILHLAFLNENKIIASTRSEGLFICDLMKRETQLIPKNPIYKTTTDNFLFEWNKRVYLGTDNGLYIINNKLEFLPLNEINKIIKGKYCVTNAAFFGSELFMSLSVTKGIHIGREENVCYNLNRESEPEQIYTHLKKSGEMGTREFYFDSSKVFIANDDGVFILDKSIKDKQQKLRSYLSRLIYNNDTILCNQATNYDASPFVFGKNEFVFEFGSNDFSDESKLVFEFYLEGYESAFNEWTENYKASYNNIKLREGEYAFHLKAKNIYGQQSDEFLYRFKILPPWYRTKTAYFLYFLIGISLIFLIVKLNAKRLVEQNKRLEKIIVDRTQTITHQKSEIEHKNKEITDSINYAQKIQLALMAGIKLLEKNLKNSIWKNPVSPKDYFLLYNPKDIVSGDFYWATELEIKGQKQFLMVTGDCTGHGVPGAFMSLLCIGFLNEITKEKQISDPGKIFDELRLRIISTLNPEGSDTERKDGMDAVLISINSTTNQLNYSAANNSFYVIRNNEITVLKADKMPVGKYSEDTFKSFTSQTFDLLEGDVVYVFTDGYADQFGGPKGKKFKYKQLEELLLEIHKMEASMQKQILLQRFNDWKGKQEQVDDVLVIGMQF